MEEYINRERARFEAKRYFKNMDEIQEDLDMLFCMLPAENVAPVRHGRWIIDSAGGKIACSDCRCIYLGYNGGLPPNYCPNCGAKLDGGADWMDIREKQSSEKRLIDANSLLRHKRKMSGADFGGEFWDEAVLISDIKNAPTVDAVEVVRCRNCKYHEDTDVTGFKHCCLIDKTVRYNDFCSYGKRKEGAD